MVNIRDTTLSQLYLIQTLANDLLWEGDVKPSVHITLGAKLIF